MNLTTKLLVLFLCTSIAESQGPAGPALRRNDDEARKIFRNAQTQTQKRGGKNQYKYKSYQDQHIPKAVLDYHDKLMAFPGHAKYGQNFNLINQTLAQDWNERPNMINPGYGIESGPFPQGQQRLFYLYSKMFKNLRVQRNETYVIGNTVVVLTRVKATMGDVPPGYPGYPMFPGVEADKLKGKSFESMKMHVHYLDNEWDGQRWVQKIRRTYHFVDWTLALDEMLTGRRPFKFPQPYTKPARNLTEVPQSIYNFYEKILSDVQVGGKNVTLMEETVQDNWSSRPNYINLVDGKGPGLNGLKSLVGLFAKMMPNLKFEMKKVWIHADKVIVLSKVHGTITGKPMGKNEIPLFPGIPADKLMNKEFTTVALDIHKIEYGRIQQSYHIEDWRTALEQMLYNKEPPCFGLYPDFTNFHVPQPVKNFYDDILSNSATYGQNMSFINETLTSDWNTRPNPFSYPGSQYQGVKAGPFPQGLKKMLGFWSTIIPDMKYERLETFRIGNKVVTINRISATMAEVHQILNEFPMFPAIPAETLKNRNFTTLAMDVNVLDDEEHHHDGSEHQGERIRRSWHFEDWTEAAHQMLDIRRPAKLDHSWHKHGKNLTSVPHSVYHFYDKILSNPTQASKNLTLLNETIAEDWAVRPNPLRPVEGGKPGLEGLQKITQLFGKVIPDLKFHRKEMFLHQDRVVVLGKITGTIQNDEEVQDRHGLPFFPGVDATEMDGKSFETTYMDVHRIYEGKIQQSYHIEDWRSAVYQMVKDRPAKDFGFDHEYINFERFNLTDHAHRAPKAIENLYDRMYNNYNDGKNQTLINQTFTEDYNMRPNPMNPQRGLQAGPLRKGLKALCSLKHVMMRDMNSTRMYTVQLGNVVLVVSNVSATMNHIPPGLPEFPMFPGIPEYKLRNKRFNTLSMDLHIMDNAQIKRSWYFTDHSLALDQMLTGRQNPKLEHEYIPRGMVLEEIPQSIYNWYDIILGNMEEHGQDDELFEETFAQDVASLPREGHHDHIINGVAPGIGGMKNEVEFLKKAFSDFQIERKATLLHEDAVIVLSKVTGVFQGTGDMIFHNRPDNENILFPGIPAEKLKGKRFETMVLQVHCIRDGKIKQTYRVFDWSTAMQQMVHNHPAPDFGFDRSFIDF
jgi:ketosteroid isomerase-like protein